jgi:hypothetical protein
MTLGRFQRSRRIVQMRLTPYRAVLGDGNGNVKAGDGLYWVRPYDAANEQNIATTGTAYRVRAGSALIVPREGRVVWIYYGPDRRLTVMAYDHDDLIQAGIDPLTVQPNDPYRTWIRFKNIQNFRALPVGTGNTPSMKTSVRQLFYHTATGDMVRWNGTNADTHIDLTDYVPADGFQCYVVLWLRTYNPNSLPSIQVTYSDHIDSVDDVLSFDELQQCADMADPDTVPIQAFRLADAQTALKIDDSVDVDLRQFINMPQVWGFPNTVDHAYRIHEYFSVVAPSAITIEDGGVVQVQDNALLLILGADEEESGGGGTSPLTTKGDLYTYSTLDTRLPVGADGQILYADPAEPTGLRWDDAPSLAYIWNINADNDDVQPVFNGDVVNILGGTGIETAIVSGPDVTINLSDTGVVAGAYTNPDVTVNAQGQVLSIADGVAPVTSVGATAPIASSGGTTPTISLNDTSVVPGTYTNASLTVDQKGRLTFAGSGAAPVTSVGATAPIASSGGATPTISLNDTAVSPGSYTYGGFTVDAKGRLTAASSGIAPNTIAIFRDEKTTGTAGGTSTSTTWNARDLNTELYDPGAIVSISSNQFTPIAGDYEIEVFAPFLGGAAAASTSRCRLYNVTGAAAVEEGINITAAVNGGAVAILSCKFTANGTDAYRIDSYTTAGRATDGLGRAASDGSAEAYTTVYLRKVA